MRVIRSISRRLIRRSFALVVALVLALLCGDKLISYTAKLIYPIKYQTEVEKYSSEFGVDTALCYAVIKCESNFNPNAESSAGAIGLMQLTPETFNFVCKNIYDFDVKDELIYDPATNIKCGVWLLSYLQKELQGEAEVIAGYNAGVNKVKEWLQSPLYSDNGETLTSIPYMETDNHIKKVLKAKELYIKLYNLE